MKPPMPIIRDVLKCSNIPGSCAHQILCYCGRGRRMDAGGDLAVSDAEIPSEH